MMTGKLGRPGSALLPLRGQNNVQGSSDMGALPDTYTAYRSVGDEDVAQSFEAAWGVELSREKGYTIPQMFDAAVDGRLKAMYIFGEDVAQTDPDTKHVVAALESLDFLVCQDIFETETTKFADVVLPASSFLEKAGTFTNAERRIQLVSPAIEPPGSAKTDFEIIKLVSSALGHEIPLETPADAMDEVAALTPALRGSQLRPAGPSWACSGRSTPMASTRRSCTSRRSLRPGGGGLAAFAALPYKAPGDEASEEFPLILVTGRRLEHYNAGTMTRRTGNLELLPSDVLEMHPADAEQLGVETGQTGHGAQPARATSRCRYRSPIGSWRGTCSRRSTSRRSVPTCSSASPRTSTRVAPSTR